MKISAFQKFIWNKLENRKVKILSIIAILLFYLYPYIFSKTGISLFELLSTILLFSSSAIPSFGYLEVVFHYRKKKNSFVKKDEILNYDKFIRVFIIFNLILISGSILSYIF